MSSAQQLAADSHGRLDVAASSVAGQRKSHRDLSLSVLARTVNDGVVAAVGRHGTYRR
jgi:hypothetical protein